MVARRVLVGHEAGHRPPDAKVEQSEISHEGSEENPSPVRGIAEAMDDEWRQQEADDGGDDECRPVRDCIPEHPGGARAHDSAPATSASRDREGTCPFCRGSRRSSAATCWYWRSSRARSATAWLRSPASTALRSA